MTRTALAAAACSLAFALAAHAQPLKGGAIAATQVDAVLTVLSVDQKARTVTVRGPKGDSHKINVPPEAQNFDQVKAGDRFRMRYLESVAVAITRGGKLGSANSEDVTLAPKGGKPGGTRVRTRVAAVIVDGVDFTNRYVAVRDAAGNGMALKVADDIPIEDLKPGDRVVVTHTEALAVELIAPAKKPAAKK